MSKQKKRSTHDLSMTTQQVVDEFVRELKETIVADIENGFQKERSHLHERVTDVLELPNFASTSQDGQKIQETQPSYKLVVNKFVKKLGNAIDADIKSGITEERVNLHKKVQKLIEIPEFTTASVTITVRNMLGEKDVFKMKRYSKLRKLMMCYCERHSTDFSTMRFFYDACHLTGETTPDQLQMKDEAEIFAVRQVVHV